MFPPAGYCFTFAVSQGSPLAFDCRAHRTLPSRLEWPFLGPRRPARGREAARAGHPDRSDLRRV